MPFLEFRGFMGLLEMWRFVINGRLIFQKWDQGLLK
jgi:hypothetical protein